MPRTLTGESRTDVYNLRAATDELASALHQFTDNQSDVGALDRARTAADRVRPLLNTLRALWFSEEGE